MSEILHKIKMDAPKAAVYRALASLEGLSSWWTSTTSGGSAPGETLLFRFGEHEIHMRIDELDADKRVAWECTDKTGEWAGTKLTFELSEEAGRTTLMFGHKAWREATPFLAHCSMKWATFLLSLREYAETGTGRPFPRDVAV